MIYKNKNFKNYENLAKKKYLEIQSNTKNKKKSILISLPDHKKINYQSQDNVLKTNDHENNFNSTNYWKKLKCLCVEIWNDESFRFCINPFRNEENRCLEYCYLSVSFVCILIFCIIFFSIISKG